MFSQCRSAIHATISALFLSASIVAQGGCPQTPKYIPHWELGISNMMIYSQEYIRYFFASDNSDIRPLPASGLSLFVARDFAASTRLVHAFTLPTREEEVLKREGETFRYYYPKLLISGIETDFLSSTIGHADTCLRMSGLLGLALPLGNQFFKYFPPITIIRTGVEVGRDTLLNIGIGYSGNISRGAWFLPFGITYRIQAGAKE